VDYIDVRSVYPAGRLDTDSEGLMLLTDDGVLQARIAEPKHEIAKVYWAQWKVLRLKLHSISCAKA